MSRDLELDVWQRVAGMVQSPSHDFHHIARVQDYADQLAGLLGVDSRLVRIAAILHDLGRGDPSRRHGLASIRASQEIAASILGSLPISEADRTVILEAIETHDQPGLRPPTIEGRILKDADFLAGFGAWGVLRIAMWSGETGRRIDDVLQRLTEGMRTRLDNLEFDQSRDTARRELLFARLFHAELERPAVIRESDRSGTYVVLEGISGAGKNTVAQGLCERLRQRNVPARLVEEPGKIFRRLRDQLGDYGSGCPALSKALFMADRAVLHENEIVPALRRGDVVLGVRSYLSTAVYQAADDVDACQTILAHEWVAVPDLLILLDLETAEALSRIEQREKPPGEYETEDQLKEHRARYDRYAEVFPARRIQKVEAGRALDDVINDVMALVEAQLNQAAS